MADSKISGTGPERDFVWLAQYLEGVGSLDAGFLAIWNVQYERARSPSLLADNGYNCPATSSSTSYRS